MQTNKAFRKTELISDLSVFRLFMFNELYRNKIYGVIDLDYFDDPNMVDILRIVMEKYDKTMKFTTAIKGLIYRNPWNQPTEVLNEKMKLVDVEKEEISSVPLEEYLKDIEIWLKKKCFVKVVKEGYNLLNDTNSLPYLEYANKIKDIEKLGFDSDMGDRFSHTTQLLEMYKKAQPRLKMGNTFWDGVTGGGCEIGTLNVIMGASGYGKTRLMVNMAMDYIKNKNNKVLYVTLEMSNKKIMEKMDSLLLDLTVEELYQLFETEEKCKKYIDVKEKLMTKMGDIVVKRYPASTATVGDFVLLLNNLKLNGFEPNVIFIDYMGIGGYKENKSASSHDIGKYIAESYRDFADENKVILWTSVQTYQGTQKKASEVNMFDVAQSKAISATADMFVTILENNQLRKIDQQIYKIEKNRHSGLTGVGIIGELNRKKYRVTAIAMRDREDQINATLQGEQPDESINRSGENEKLRNNRVGEKIANGDESPYERKYSRLERPTRSA